MVMKVSNSILRGITLRGYSTDCSDILSANALKGLVNYLRKD
jgi:hypothetical protein